jgi:hypothetical protein
MATPFNDRIRQSPVQSSGSAADTSTIFHRRSSETFYNAVSGPISGQIVNSEQNADRGSGSVIIPQKAWLGELWLSKALRSRMEEKNLPCHL